MKRRRRRSTISSTFILIVPATWLRKPSSLYCGTNSMPDLPSFSDFVTSTARSEEHTSEFQSPCNLVCRLLLEQTTSSRRREGRTVSSSRDFARFGVQSLRVPISCEIGLPCGLSAPCDCYRDPGSQGSSDVPAYSRILRPP